MAEPASTAPGVHTKPRFRPRLSSISTLHRTVHFRSPSWTSSDAIVPRLFTQRSPRRLLTAAACADLQPGSAARLRETCSHPIHSFPFTRCETIFSYGGMNSRYHTPPLFETLVATSVAGTSSNLRCLPVLVAGDHDSRLYRQSIQRARSRDLAVSEA
jgi:hypothetical protein